MSAASQLKLVKAGAGNALLAHIPQHGRTFNFSKLAPIGRSFLAQVIVAFTKRAGSHSSSTAAADYATINEILGWIIRNINHFPGLALKLKSNFGAISAKDWELILQTWRDDYSTRQNHLKTSTKAACIRRANALLDHWTKCGLIPPVARLKFIKNYAKHTRPKRCFGEVSRVAPATASHRPPADAVGDGSQIDELIKTDFVQALIAEVGEFHGSTQEYAQAVMRLNNKRLRDLRACAEKSLERGYVQFKEGERLLAASDMSHDEIAAVLHEKHGSLAARAHALQKLFPPDKPEISLSRYLTYVDGEYGGIIPPCNRNRLNQFHLSFCRRFGKIEIVRHYLAPSPEALCAAQVIFQIDTGANFSVFQSLERNGVADSDQPGHKRITGFKDRAGGKLIVNELPVRDPVNKISCVRAIEMYDEMSARLRRHVGAPERGQLFLQHTRRGVKIIDVHCAAKQFKKFLSRHEELRGLPFTTDMIRPSVLLQVTHERDGNLLAAKLLASHSSDSVTGRYTGKYPTHVIYENQIRKFQELLQVVSASDVEGAFAKLGITEEQAKGLLSEAHRTGLGVACLSPKAGYQPGTAAGTDCSTLERCSGCPLRFVVATVANVTDLILFNRHIEESRPEVESTRPERWAEYWLPWLVFTEVALEKMQSGVEAAVYLKAKAAAEERLASGTVNFPPLW